jgi:hypothetical protein
MGEEKPSAVNWTVVHCAFSCAMYEITSVFFLMYLYDAAGWLYKLTYTYMYLLSTYLLSTISTIYKKNDKTEEKETTLQLQNT